MKSMTLGLTLSLLGGVAMAQTPPQPSPPPPIRQPAAGPVPQPTPPAAQNGGAQPQPAPQASAQAGQPHPGAPGESGPPEGEIIETPNGLYLVRPGQGSAQHLDMGRMGMGQRGAAQNGPAVTSDDDESMDDMADETPQVPPPPHPHKPLPPRPPQGKGASFRIRTPNLNVGVKCPEDESIKACVDAISQLMDKVGAQPH